MYFYWKFSVTARNLKNFTKRKSSQQKSNRKQAIQNNSSQSNIQNAKKQSYARRMLPKVALAREREPEEKQFSQRTQHRWVSSISLFRPPLPLAERTPSPHYVSALAKWMGKRARRSYIIHTPSASSSSSSTLVSRIASFLRWLQDDGDACASGWCIYTRRLFAGDARTNFASDEQRRCKYLHADQKPRAPNEL